MIDFRNHYWIIAGADVYSSASNTIIAPNDPGYAGWLNFNQPSQIASEADLAVTLQPQNILPAWMFNSTDTFIQPTTTTYTYGQLAAYNADARWRRRNSGIIITSLSSVAFMSDEASVNDINSSYNYGQVNAGATFHWKMSNGSFVTLDTTKITTLHNDVLNYVQTCYACESTTLTNINGGSIATLAAIDSAFAAISNVFP